MVSVSKYFYIFCSLALTISVSYAQQPPDLATVNHMSDEEFEVYLSSLPKFTPEEMEDLNIRADEILERWGFPPDTPAPKQKCCRRAPRTNKRQS